MRRTSSLILPLSFLLSWASAEENLPRALVDDFRQGDTLRYTMDGSIPDRNSPFVVYGSNTVFVSRTTTFKARLYRPGYLPSEVQSRSVHVAGSNFYYTVRDGWNIVSIPVTVSDRRKVAVFPTAASYAYAFSATLGFVRRDTLQNGLGYFLKFNGEQTVYIPGVLRTADTVAVQQGWNLIGTISRPVPDTAVRQVPAGIIGSFIYEYNGGYSVARTLWPAVGYWVKATVPGVLILSTFQSDLKNEPIARSFDVDKAIRLSFSDSNGSKQTLCVSPHLLDKTALNFFELPPPPPGEAFDVRFGSNRMLEAIQGDKEQIPVYVSHARYPVTIRWETKDELADITLMVGATEISLNQQRSVTVPDSKDSIFLKAAGHSALPRNFSLDNNYPNPFNPTTTIRYYLPGQSYVTLKLYDILGRQVAALVDGVESPGYKSVQWNANGVGSGVYFCRFQAGRFSSVKKMLLLK